MYLIGYDIGSSSIKAALVEASTGKTLSIKQYPESEMEIISKQTGWAEQQPEVWWDNVKIATERLLEETKVNPADIKSIGISYQMHGMVLVDKDYQVLRPSIIWCDSRAVEVGNRAFEEIGAEKCLTHLLNSPGNFTASKVKWVKDHEPEVYARIHKMLLPGDFIALRMTDRACTTVSGLSEAMLWDFKNENVASFLLENYGINESLIPEIVNTVGDQGTLTQAAADFLGLAVGTQVSYRAGDQPNNAMSLNVLNPGEIAATGGTSGVVYGIVDKPQVDPKTRVNPFIHVNHTSSDPRIGILLCVNGAGIQYSWMKQMLASEGTTYEEIERLAATAPVNSDGLRVIPFGNGAERILENENVGSQVINLHFNTHKKAHLYRAALEGIAYSFIYGVEIMQHIGMEVSVIKVGNDNLFQSAIFSNTISNVLGCKIEMLDATGAVGAAKASGVGIGFYQSLGEAFEKVVPVKVYENGQDRAAYQAGYKLWKTDLEKILAKN
ncbi:FGGY family carbohydrate kinase [Reichenbachiella carrageenanivorans]|uniref:FGGY family carbohydrate kinase n=1 Tax=Reichenbachiella carrageenanivorans TaxID=2979869 RepID=A0ABY6CZM9_9BACT|nr:FGGY family carbohydrate kinase [Reichenbachiella carrageenanivorans]UXX79367.1 FGGY family carbohydrate kinase [Reichenbachiella carrageenanivorans]